MRSFFDLVGFEYKKIFKRKSAVVSIAIIMILSLISPVGVFIGKVYIGDGLFESNYSAMAKDRDYARALAGRSIDEMLLSEVRDAFWKVQPDGNRAVINGIESYSSTPGYQEYGRPYNAIYNIAYSVYGSKHRLMQNVTQEQMQNFYQIRHAEISNNINAMDISEQSKEKLISLDSQLKTPFIFDYTQGYEYFFAMFYSIGIFAAFVIAICLAPVFAGEYVAHTDQLILSSKFGKNKIISAKLFTGFSFGAGLCAVMAILTYFAGAVIFGFDGANAPVQLWFVSCIYPMTMWQAAVVCVICGLFAAIMVGGITLLLSSLFKSPFGVIIIMSLLIFIPMMIPSMMPSNMKWAATSLLDYTPFELFGLTIPPYIFMPVFAAVLTAILCPFAWQSFKKHQVG